jgi:hypothetical protein
LAVRRRESSRLRWKSRRSGFVAVGVRADAEGRSFSLSDRLRETDTVLVVSPDSLAVTGKPLAFETRTATGP